MPVTKPCDERMRILHILLSQGFAGSERSTAESCNAQSLRHTVGLVVRANHRSSQGQSVVDHLSPEVQVIELPRWWGRQKALQAGIEVFQPDVIHCHLRRATRMALKLRFDRMEAFLSAKPGVRPPRVATLHVEPNSKAYLGMDGLICNAQWQIEAVKAMAPAYPGLLFKANNSVIPHPRLPKEKRQALRQSLGIGEHDFFVGGAGRYTHEKGFDQVISAFRQLPHERLRLRLFGQGRALTELQTLARNDPRIQVLGFRDDIKDLYQAMDVFICPSRWEPLPRVVLEAMDAGTPVIASMAEGCKELIQRYEGQLFEIDNIAQLAACIEETLQRGPSRTQIDLSEHHLENANAGVERFYEECRRHAASLSSRLYNSVS